MAQQSAHHGPAPAHSITPVEDDDFRANGDDGSRPQSTGRISIVSNSVWEEQLLILLVYWRNEMF